MKILKCHKCNKTNNKIVSCIDCNKPVCHQRDPCSFACTKCQKTCCVSCIIFCDCDSVYCKEHEYSCKC